MTFLKTYYDCPRDYRKKYWKVVLGIVGKTIVTALAVSAMGVLLIGLTQK